jgi:hypothetical protein
VSFVDEVSSIHGDGASGAAGGAALALLCACAISAAGLLGAVGVEGLERAGEQHDRDVAVVGIRLDVLADLVAVLLRHDDVGEDDVGAHLGEFGDCLRAVVDRGDLVVAVGKRELDDLLYGDTVVRKKDLFRH